MGGLFFLRLAVGSIFIVHAVPKLQNPKAMASGMGWTPGQVIGLGLVEFMSALGIIGGVGTEFATLVLMTVMVGAMYHKMGKWNIPFTSGNSTGWEFDFLIFASLFSIYLKY